MVATATLLTRDIQGESLSAATDRLVNQILFIEGVVDVVGNSFQVLQNLGTDMNIKVGSGTAFDRAVVSGDLAGQGVFITEHQNATQVLAVAASHATLDRIDRVILRVYDDTFDSSGNDFADIEVLTGTPDASPVAPALPSTAISLATILVQNAVTQIVTGDITDERVEYSLAPSLGHQEVRGSAEDATASIVGAAAAVVSVNLVIPTNWNSWECEAYATYVREVKDAAAPADILLVFIRIDGTDQQAQSQVSSADVDASAGASLFIAGAVGGHRTGMTTTGSRTIEMRASENSGAGFTIRDSYLYARATRTS